MRRLKRWIRTSLRALGLEVHRRRPFGSDLPGDLATILGRDRRLVILDVGANHGQTALTFAEEFPQARIHSFEPNPEAFRALTQNLASHQRVAVYPWALGPRRETRALHLTQSTLTSSLLPPSAEAPRYLGDMVAEAGEATVTVTTVDEFLQEHQIAHVDLLKLDVQGFELEVLAGAKASLDQRRISAILTEVNFVKLYDGQASFLDLYQALDRTGHRLVGLYHGDYRAGPYLAWCDALFVSPTALESRRGGA